VPRALVSVSDKSGIVEFAQGLAAMGYELISTGGTADALRRAGLPVREVSDVTGFPEIMDGRVKTLHPAVHAGLLADVRLDEHRAALRQHGIEEIQVLAVNLYPFAQVIAGPHTLRDAIENIDIGGPAMIRAAAKNADNVVVVVDPNDYEPVLSALADGVSEELRQTLRAKAFQHTAWYDATIARYLARFSGHTAPPQEFAIGLNLHTRLRYGENPHQAAALYRDPLCSGGIPHARQLWGKELSYNNVLDADAAWELVCDLAPNACAIIKHGNPCGGAEGATAAESFELARAADPVSAFGGIAAVHGAVDQAAAAAMTRAGNFLEVVVATEFSAEALETFQSRSGWGQSVRLLEVEPATPSSEWRLRTLRGGGLLQEADEDPGLSWRVVTERSPTPEEDVGLRFAWRVVQHVRSNAIVVARGGRMLGVGAGQMNRVLSVQLALAQAGADAKGASLASDAFFPFADSVEAAAQAGISAIVQPGGSKRDGEVIAAANAAGIAMAFTGTRHFKH